MNQNQLHDDPNYMESLLADPILVAPGLLQSLQEAEIVRLLRDATKDLQAYPTAGISCLESAEATLGNALDLLYRHHPGCRCYDCFTG